MVYILQSFLPIFSYAQESRLSHAKFGATVSQAASRSLLADLKDDYLWFNSRAASQIDSLANRVDTSVSPLPLVVKAEPTKSQGVLLLEADLAQQKQPQQRVHFDVNWHLPRLEKYMKLKFESRDERRTRGRNRSLREQQRADQPLFLGLIFGGNWDRVSFNYRPQLNNSNGFGLDNSIEASTTFKHNQFELAPRLEIFANHDEGFGTSSLLNLIFHGSEYFTVFQNNEGRLISLSDQLEVSHSIGANYSQSARLLWSVSFGQFYANHMPGYGLKSFGAQVGFDYLAIPEKLNAGTTYYINHLASTGFGREDGVVFHTKMTF